MRSANWYDEVNFGGWDSIVCVYAVQAMEAMRRLSHWIGREASETAGYAALVANARVAYNARFWDEEKGWYREWVDVDDRPRSTGYVWPQFVAMTELANISSAAQQRRTFAAIDASYARLRSTYNITAEQQWCTPDNLNKLNPHDCHGALRRRSARATNPARVNARALLQASVGRGQPTKVVAASSGRAGGRCTRAHGTRAPTPRSRSGSACSAARRATTAASAPPLSGSRTTPGARPPRLERPPLPCQPACAPPPPPPPPPVCEADGGWVGGCRAAQARSRTASRTAGATCCWIRSSPSGVSCAAPSASSRR
eukprot:SAG11_NODE_317_length_10836_cov_7.445469_5_plen_313_part_00